MAIIENKEVSGSGFRKTIDEDSMEMIMDMTQVSQYQKPHHSAVRFCNRKKLSKKYINWCRESRRSL